MWLKISTHASKYCLANVRKVQTVAFEPKDIRHPQNNFECPWQYNVALTKDLDWGPTPTALILSIDFEDGSQESWIVPDKSSFLMSETGKTVDRL